MKKNIIVSLMTLCSALAVFLVFIFFKDLKNMNYENFYNTNVIMIFIVCLLFYFLYKKNYNIRLKRIDNILCIFFSFCMIIGEAYVSSGTLSVLFKNILTILIVIIKLIGYSSLFRVLYNYLMTFISGLKYKEINIKNRRIKWYINMLEKYPFRTSFTTLFILWGIYLIAFYPIVLSPDPSFQIRQYFNVPTKYIDWVIQRDPNVFMTSHHPITQTFLLGWCIEFGRFILNDNFGLFCYTLFQTIIYISVFAYTIKVLKKNNLSNKICLIVLSLYIIVPMYGFYTVSAVKDTLYTAFMILFILFIYDIVKNYKDKKITIKYSIYIFVVMLLMSLFRHNGSYIIVLTIPFVLFYSRKNIIRIGLSTLMFFVSLYTFNNVLVPNLGISDGSVREMLSLPFQQTARYVKYHDDELTDNEKKVIDKILTYETIASRYKPEIADPVKNEFNKYTKTEDLIDYFKVWFACFLKHPETYVDATLNNIYGYFYPNAHNWYLYSNFDDRITQNDLVDYSYNNLSGLRNLLSGYGNIFPYIPVVGLISSIGANTWFLLILTIYVLKKNKKYLIVLLPMFISLLFCIISPVNTYFRYTMPYIFPLPVITMLLLNDLRGEKNEKK